MLWPPGSLNVGSQIYHFLGIFARGGGMNSYKIFTVDYLIFSYKVRKLWHSSTPFSSQNQNYYQIELMTVNMTNH